MPPTPSRADCTVWQESVRAHLLDSARVHQQIADTCMGAIMAAADLLVEAFTNGGKLLLCGNGGSAADCEHIAAEFMNRLTADFPRAGLPAVALTADVAFLTAFTNDYRFEDVYARQVETLGRPGDVLLAVSTSGGSPNVVAAVTAAHARAMTTIALTGEAGTLGDLTTVAVRVPTTNSQHIQEGYLTVAHALCAVVERRLFA